MNAILIFFALTELLLTVRPSYSCTPPPGAFEMTFKEVFDSSKIVWKLRVISTHSRKDDSGSSYFGDLTLYYCKVRRLYKGCRLDIKSRRVWLALSNICGGSINAPSPLLMMIPNGTSLVTLNLPSDNSVAIAERHMGENGNAKLSLEKRFWSRLNRFENSKSVYSSSSFLTDSLSLTPSPSATSSPNPVGKEKTVKAYFFSVFDYRSSFSSLQKRNKKFLRRNIDLSCWEESPPMTVCCLSSMRLCCTAVCECL